MRNDYTCKDVFVGIDVHKKSYSVYCVCDHEKVKSWSMGFYAQRPSMFPAVKTWSLATFLFLSIDFCRLR